MNKEDIIAMAIKSHLVMYDYNHPSLEAFAKLIAEKEREACAEVCDEIYTHSIEDWEGANWCGDAIRARGQA